MASAPNSAPVPVAELEYEHSPLEDAVIRYRKQLILVGVLAVVGSIGYFGSKLWKEGQHKEAALAFTRAQTVGDLRTVASTHAGQSAAGNALLKAAQLLAEDGKGREASEELNKFLSTYPQHPLADLAKFRLAEVQMQEGASQDAVTRFQEVANLPNSPYAALALLRIADQKWQEGKTDEAKKIYEEIPRKNGGNRMFAIAEQRLKQIKLAPPALIDFVPEVPPPPGGATPGGPPGLDMTPPSAAAIEKTIASPGLLGDDPSPAGTSLTPEAPPANSDSLLPPPVLPPPVK